MAQHALSLLPRSLRTRGLGWLCWACLVLGCNPVQGIQDTSDAVVPAKTRYIAGPGTRLAQGHFRSASYGQTSRDTYVFARSADPDSASLFVMSKTNPEPCEIPNVALFGGPYSSDKDAEAPPAIFYFHDLDEQGLGTLEAVDTSCRSLALGQTNVAPSFFPHPDGMVFLHVGDDASLELVDTRGVAQEPFALGVKRVLRLDAGYAVLASGQLLIFDLYWHEVGRFGDGVESIARSGDQVLALDSGGLEQVTVTRPDPYTLDLQANWSTLDPMACELGASGEAVVYRSPCGEPLLNARFGESGELTTFVSDADPRHAKVVTPLTDGNASSAWLFYLTDIDTQTELGTLRARSPAGDELLLGTSADERYAGLDENGVAGWAVVDVVGNHGRLLRWFTNAIATLATDVLIAPRPSALLEPRIFLHDGSHSLDQEPLRGSGDLVLSDFEDPAGSLGFLWLGILQPLAERVPRQSLRVDFTGRHLALLHDFEAGTGELSWAPTDGAALGPSLAWTRLGSGVPLAQYAFLDFARLPGIAFIDEASSSGSGKLEYFNFELEARAEINRGVSDFEPVGIPPGILYTIPAGKNAGIWFAEAK